MKLYVMMLRTLAMTAIVCTSLLVVMSDQGETSEPWEFVPVESVQ